MRARSRITVVEDVVFKVNGSTLEYVETVRMFLAVSVVCREGRLACGRDDLCAETVGTSVGELDLMSQRVDTSLLVEELENTEF